MNILKPLCLLGLFSLHFIAAKAQASYNPDIIEKLIVSGPQKLPDIEMVSVTSGEKINLSELKPADLKFPEKPTLIFFWQTYCASCLLSLEILLDEGLHKEFNFVTVHISDPVLPSRKESSESIQELLAEHKAGTLMNYRISSEAFKKNFSPDGYAALWMFLNRDLKIEDLYASKTAGKSHAMGIFSRLENGNYSGRKIIKGLPTIDGLQELKWNNQYVTLQKINNHTILKRYERQDSTGDNTALIGSRSFLIIGDTLVADGSIKDLYPDGKKRWKRKP